MGLFNVKIHRHHESSRFHTDWDLEQALTELDIPTGLLNCNSEVVSLEGAKEFFQNPTVANPPLHPGCLIKKALDARGITQGELGDLLGLNRVVVNQLINGKRPVSMETALLLEEVLQVPAHLLLRMQLDFDLHQQRQQLLKARKDNSDNELRKKMDAILARIADLQFVRSPFYRPYYEEYLHKYYDSPQ